MATRVKTVEYWFPELPSVTDNTDSLLTQITLYLPENSKVFRSVCMDVLIQDAEITANNVSRRQLSLRIGASGYTVVNNTVAISATSEQKWVNMSADFTALFNTSWSGTSMTCDGKVLFDNAIVTPSQNWRSCTTKLTITYEYDDTSTTQVKTVKFPLITPISSLSLTKPGTAVDTIPALDTWCPEASKTFRQITLVVQGNDEYAGTVDRALVWEIDTLGTYSSGLHESALNTACFFIHNQIQTFTTSATHSFYLWCATACMAHTQAWLNITYEYDESASTTILNSLMLPMAFAGAAGGTTNADYQRGQIDFWIEEPATITIQRSALQLFWTQSDVLTGFQCRVNSGSWSGAQTSLASTVAGSCCSSFRCDNAITLSRGVNTLKADAYRTNTSILANALSSFWLLNYTSGKSSQGSGAHNHTVNRNILAHGTASNSRENIIAAIAMNIPESDYFINNFGVEGMITPNSASGHSGFSLQVERLTAENGVTWLDIYRDFYDVDNLIGKFSFYGSTDKDLYQFPNDARPRVDLKTARRYRSFNSASGWRTINALYTYHTITYTVSGTVSGSAGGTVTLGLISEYDKEIKKQTTRTGNGTYSFTWYDDTQQVYVDAYEDSTHLFRSALGYPS